MFTAINMYTHEVIGSSDCFGAWMSFAKDRRLSIIVTSKRTGKKCNIYSNSQCFRRSSWY